MSVNAAELALLINREGQSPAHRESAEMFRNFAEEIREKEGPITIFTPNDLEERAQLPLLDHMITYGQQLQDVGNKTENAYLINMGNQILSISEKYEKNEQFTASPRSKARISGHMVSNPLIREITKDLFVAIALIDAKAFPNQPFSPGSKRTLMQVQQVTGIVVDATLALKLYDEILQERLDKSGFLPEKNKQRGFTPQNQYGLTPQQREVVAYLQKKVSIETIAEELHRTPKNIKDVLRIIRKKLTVEQLIELGLDY
ncbi:MAG TPA: hypothetical protein VLF89_01375 [Candidatus Saccharimonadales bacterium]|nr:hypothetical protein [Candidatus Saccharimonadales bacterium]